jgi:hypothetical protein
LPARRPSPGRPQNLGRIYRVYTGCGEHLTGWREGQLDNILQAAAGQYL